MKYYYISISNSIYYGLEAEYLWVVKSGCRWTNIGEMSKSICKGFQVIKDCQKLEQVKRIRYALSSSHSFTD